MSYILQHTAESIDRKLCLIDENKNLLVYPYNSTLPSGLEDVGDGSILTSERNGDYSEESFVLSDKCILPEGKYTVSLHITDILEVPTTVSGFVLRVVLNNGNPIDVTDSRVIDVAAGTTAVVSLVVPSYFDTGLVIKPQIEAGTVKTNWAPNMDKIGTYVDRRFNGTNAKIKVLDEKIKKLPIGEGGTCDCADEIVAINSRVEELSREIAMATIFQGEFDYEATYTSGDIVTCNGNVYLCLNSSPSHSVDTTDWKKLAGSVSDKGELYNNDVELYRAGDIVTYQGNQYIFVGEMNSSDGRPMEYYPWVKLGGEGGNANVDASTNDAVLKWNSSSNKIVESKVKVDNNGSVILSDGTTSGSHSIVGGTNDKSVISNILGTLGSAAVSVDKPTSSANATISIGSGTKVLSTGSNAIGVLNTVGVKGYYYTN